MISRNSSFVCPKCINDIVTIKYVEPLKNKEGRVLITEHLRCKCCICEYSWKEQCKDSK